MLYRPVPRVRVRLGLGLGLGLPNPNPNPSDPNIRKEWRNFIFNEDPDHVSKNSRFKVLYYSSHTQSYRV